MTTPLPPDPDAFARIRSGLETPRARPVPMGWLVGAAAFAAVAARLSAAAVILGAPGIDKGAVHQEASAWGTVKTAR